MRQVTHILVLGLLAGLVAGCGTHSTPVVAEPELTPAQANFEAIWRASQNVLGDYYFRIDRRDRRAGLMSTYPMTAQYVTEAWRKDAATKADLDESALQTIRRQAIVQITPTENDPADYVAAVTVENWRSERPARQLTTVSQAYSLFGVAGNLATEDTRVQLDEYDVSLGRDEPLEAKIATDIQAEKARILTEQ